MVGYITQDDLIGDMPFEVIQAALRDTSSVRTPEQVWSTIMETVERAIHGALAPRFTPPYAEGDGILDTVRDAARVLTLERLYLRRPYLDQSPYATPARDALKHLRELGQSRLKSPANSAPPRRSSISVQLTPMSTVPRRRERP